MVEKNDPQRLRILSAAYWRLAAHAFRETRLLTFAAIILALRVAVKAVSIPLAAGLSITFDCYVNALGSLVYGPLMGLLVGALSDTLGALLFPSGPYFFPFIFVEMSSGFIFGLFFWRRPLSVNRALLSKFTVNVVCNMVLTSVTMKWYYYVFYGVEKAETYAVINLVRICKNLVLFPVEAMLITLLLHALLPALRQCGFSYVRAIDLKLERKHYLMIAALLLISVAIVLVYVFWGADFIKANNIKWL